MINVFPKNEEELHVMDNTCNCNPKVEFEDGVMILVHNELLCSDSVENAIEENTDSLLEGYRKCKISKEEIIELLHTAISDEEYEVAISIQEVLNSIDSDE